MPLTDVQRIDADHGVKVVPDLADYDESSPDWTEAEYRAAVDGSRSIVGFWEGEPGWVRIDDWPYNEVCVLLEGAVALADDTGNRLEFAAGEAFLIPAGFRGVWHTLQRTKKVFVGIVRDEEK